MHTGHLLWRGVFLLQQPPSPMGMGDSAFSLQSHRSHTAETPSWVWDCALDPR